MYQPQKSTTAKQQTEKDPDYLNAVMEAKCRNNYDEINDILKNMRPYADELPLANKLATFPWTLTSSFGMGKLSAKEILHKNISR